MPRPATAKGRGPWAFFCLVVVTACCLPASGRVGPAAADAAGRRRLSQAESTSAGAQLDQQDDMQQLVENMVPKEPPVWNETVTVNNTQELREMFCRADGALVDVLDPSRCQNRSMEPLSINVVLASDIFLLGVHLPVLNGVVKIEGTCHEVEGRNGQACTIHAVDNSCCGCPSIFLGGSTEICALCRVGDMENTQPIQVGAGSRLWMELIDVCGGRSESDGGNISLLPANKTAWETQDSAGLAFFSAKNVTITKGLSETRGGAMSIKAGGLVELTAVTFQENFALVSAIKDPSHDIMIKGYGGLIMGEMPGPVLYKLEAALGTGGGPFAQGQLYERLPPLLPVLPDDSTATGPYSGGTGGSGPAGSGEGGGTSGGLKLDFGVIIGIIGGCIAVAVILGGTFICVFCRFGHRAEVPGAVPPPAMTVAPQKRTGPDPKSGLSSKMYFDERPGSDWRVKGNPSAFRGNNVVAMQKEAMEIEARVKKFKEVQAEQRRSHMSLQGFIVPDPQEMEAAIPSGQGMMPDAEYTPKIAKQYSLNRQPGSRVRHPSARAKAAAGSTRRLAAWHVPDNGDDDSLHAHLAALPLPNPETGKIEASASKREIGANVFDSLKGMPSVANKVRLKQEESKRQLQGHIKQSPPGKSGSRRNLKSHRNLNSGFRVCLAADVAESAPGHGRGMSKSYRQLRPEEIDVPGTTRITRSTRHLNATEGAEELTPVERFDDPNVR